jgi:hypothetical protein
MAAPPVVAAPPFGSPFNDSDAGDDVAFFNQFDNSNAELQPPPTQRPPTQPPLQQPPPQQPQYHQQQQADVYSFASQPQPQVPAYSSYDQVGGQYGGQYPPQNGGYYGYDQATAATAQHGQQGQQEQQGQGQPGYYQQQAGYPPAQHHPPVNDTAMHAHAPGQQQYYQGGYPPAQGKWD